MNTIFAQNYIESGFSLDDSNKLVNCINDALKTSDNEKIVIDFSGVKFFTTQFFNNSLGKYIIQMSPKIFDEKFEIVNLTDVGQATFRHSYDNAVSYYKLPPDKRLAQDNIINQIEDL